MPSPDARIPGVESSHQLLVRALLLPTTGDVVPLEGLVGGSVTRDATAATRGQCDLTFVDDGSLGLVPTDSGDHLVPYGNEIQVKRGIRRPDGTEQLESLGIFRIQDVDVTDQADSHEIRVTGFDRSKRISDAKFEGPYQVDGGADYLTEILKTVQGGWPLVPYNADDFTAVSYDTVLSIAEEGDDRWDFAQALAEFAGMNLYFDREGVLRLLPVPSVTGATPAAHLVEGDGGLLISADLTWTRESAFNRVTYTGESTDVDGEPPRGTAQDDNPNSPTNYNGSFGKVPIWASSSLITTAEQAQAAATGKLNKEMGTSRSISFGSLVDPALQEDDVVWITRTRTGIDEAHIIDSLTYPLSATESMSGQTRAAVVQ